MKIKGAVWIIPVLILSFGCKNSRKSAESDQKTSVDSLIYLTHDQQNTMNMQFISMREVSIPDKVYADGYISVPPGNEARISPMIPGYITSIPYLEGEKVAKGSEVLRIKSREAIDLQERYLDLLSRFNYLENEYNRQKLLNDNNVNARKTFLLAESDYISTRANLEGIRKKLIFTGIDLTRLEQGNIASELSIRTPVAGYITKEDLKIGEYVNPDEVLIEVTNPDHLHVELNVFEKDASRVKPGHRFTLHVNNLDSIMKGEVFMVNKKLDDEKRTLSVHGDFDRMPGVLPGMFAEAEIYVDIRKGWMLPNDAIFRGEKKNFIFEIREEADKIMLKPISVTLGRDYGELTEIIGPEGFHPEIPGKQFAMNGLYYLASLIPGN